MTQPSINSADIPQANQLSKVRQLVELHLGSKLTPARLQRTFGLAPRHLSYYRKAATTLGLLTEAKKGLYEPTSLGRELAGTQQQSREEQVLLLECIGRAASLAPFSDYLHGKEQLSLGDLVALISEKSGLQKTTATRRAQCLQQWRESLASLEGMLGGATQLSELPPRIQETIDSACRLIRHAVEHYNAFRCEVRGLIVVEHADQALELVAKAKLAISGKPEVFESNEFTLKRCCNAISVLPEFDSNKNFTVPPLLALLHRQRNMARHAGRNVEDDLLALVVAQATRTFLIWVKLFFGLSLEDVFPRRCGLALPSLDIDLPEVLNRHVERLKRAHRDGESVTALELRSSLYLAAALNADLSDEEKEAIFTDGIGHTVRSAEIIKLLAATNKRVSKKDVAAASAIVGSAPALRVVSKTQGPRIGAVPVYESPKHPNAVPVSSPLIGHALSDPRTVLDIEMATWHATIKAGHTDYLSHSVLVRLYRWRDDPSLAELTDDEIEALVLSSAKKHLPPWAWLARWGKARQLQWAADRLRDEADNDILPVLARIVWLGTGEHFKKAIAKHSKDRRTTIRRTINDLLDSYDLADKATRLRVENSLIREAEMLDEFEGASGRGFDVSVALLDGDAKTVAELLASGRHGISRLREAFPVQEPKVQEAIAKWVGRVRSPESVAFALDHVLNGSERIRASCRDCLKRFDLLTYCMFVSGKA